MSIFNKRADEFVFGTHGDDVLTGNSHTDYITGRRGNDEIGDKRMQAYTHGDDDFYFGGRGNDVFTSLYGDDTMNGNRGSDRFFVRNDEFNEITINGGLGVDTVRISGLSDYDIESHGNRMTLTDGDHVIHLKNVEHLTEWGF